MFCRLEPINDTIFNAINAALVIYNDDPERLFKGLHELQEKHCPAGYGEIKINVNDLNKNNIKDSIIEGYNASEKLDITPDPEKVPFCSVEISIQENSISGIMKIKRNDGSVFLETPITGVYKIEDLPVSRAYASVPIVFLHTHYQNRDTDKGIFEIFSTDDEFKGCSGGMYEIPVSAFKFKCK